MQQRILTAMLMLSVPVAAQWKVGGRDVQFHGFFQQGFAASSGNNFLTMKTRGGSFSMTDGGLNVSTKLTPKFRVGVQAFSRNIGDMGNGKVYLDWAVADYKFTEYFGVRGGKVKTTLGLFTDTQDMEFVHTWALLPQSVYPTDLRATTIAHVGGDVYGSLGLGKAGRLSYTVYGGSRPNDHRGGYFLGTRDGGAPLQSYDTWAKGADVRWTSPQGVTVGYSYYGIGGHGVLKQTNINGTPIPGGGIPFRFDYSKSNTNAVYADFQRDKVRVYGEYWLTDSDLRFSWLPIAPALIRNRMWYVAGSYRVHEKLEFGSYYNEFVDNRTLGFSPSNGIRGPVVTARVDINKYWNVKVEGHFIDGYGSPFSLRSFYPSTNPRGFKERTNVFLIRTGLVF